jgi:hypothetical protein
MTVSERWAEIASNALPVLRWSGVLRPGQEVVVVESYDQFGTIRADGRGQISRPALQSESGRLPLRPRRTRRRLPADEA